MVVCWATGAVDAAEIRRKVFSLPAGEASEALSKFTEQSGEQVVYLLNQVKGVRTNPVNGRYSAREAIQRLVADTVLRVVEDKQTGAFMIQRGSSAAPPAGGAEAQERPAPERKRSDR
ncbi:MAG: STN domain-containing protein [Verrucomicrobiota bacterium]